MIPIETTCIVTQRSILDITNNVAEHIIRCYVHRDTTGWSPTDSGDREALGFLLLAYLYIPFQDSAVCTNQKKTPATLKNNTKSLVKNG